MNIQPKFISVTNAEFINAIFPNLTPDEYCWTTSFAQSPEHGSWAGKRSYPDQIDDTAHANSYFCVSALKPFPFGVRSRKKDNFSRLMCVVVDDPEDFDVTPSWKLETSKNNYQIGFILSEPISDLGVADRLHAALANQKLIKADSSGNNPVRYVRMPVGLNTKYETPFQHHMVDWTPELRFSLEEICTGLGLNYNSILTGISIAKKIDFTPTAEYTPDRHYYELISSGESYHDPINIMSARLHSRGMSPQNIVETIQGVMEVSNDGTARWKTRYDDIIRSVRTAMDKFQPNIKAEPFVQVTGDYLLDKMQAIYGDQLSSVYEAPDELVEGLLTIGSLAVLYGDSNSGKTFLALSIAACIAMGTDCYGRKTDPGLVIYLACEAPASIRARVQALKRYYQNDLENLIIVQVPINFYTGDGDANDVIELVKIVQEKKGKKVRLIVGDTLARMSAGANENSGEDMGPVMARFDAVAKPTNACQLIIHHNGKDAAKGSRGWSGIRAHIDTEIEVTEKDGVRSVTVTKQRELPSKGETIYFKLHVMEMGTTKFGKKATTCVAIPDTESQDVQPHAKVTKHDENVRLFERMWWGSGARVYEGSPYIVRNEIMSLLIESGTAKRTAENKLSPSRKDGFIMPLLNAGILQPCMDGWIFINEVQASIMLMQKNSGN